MGGQNAEGVCCIGALALGERNFMPRIEKLRCVICDCRVTGFFFKMPIPMDSKFITKDNLTIDELLKTLLRDANDASTAAYNQIIKNCNRDGIFH